MWNSETTICEKRLILLRYEALRTNMKQGLGARGGNRIKPLRCGFLATFKAVKCLVPTGIPTILYAGSALVTDGWQER